MTIATVPANLGGVDLSGIRANMLAVNEAAGLLYYTQSEGEPENTQLFAYDYINNRHILINSDVEDHGVTLGNSGLQGGAAAFHNGNLYLGVDSVQGSNDQIYIISFDAEGTEIELARTLGPRITLSGHDWGDIAIDAANNFLLSFTTDYGLQRYNLSTGALFDNPVPSLSTWGIVGTVQAATDPDGHAYVVGMHDVSPRDVPSIRQIDPVTGQPTGAIFHLTTNGVTTLSGQPSDAALLPVATGRIAGTAHYDGTQVGAANVSISLFDDVDNDGVIDAQDRLLDTVTTGSDGTYLFTGVLPGNFVVRVEHPNGVAPTRAGADILRLGQSVDDIDFAVVNTVPQNEASVPLETSEDFPIDLLLEGLFISDIDENVTTVSLSVLHGTLSIALAGGATITSGASGSSALTIGGTQADINDTLATLRYRADANFNGIDRLSITSQDSAGGEDVDIADIHVSPVNDVPTAPATKSVSTSEDTTSTAVDIDAGDIDGDRLIYSLKQGAEPSKGTVSFSGDRFTYTPTADANGSDTFTIVASDGRGGRVEQAVSVAIAPMNDAPVAAATNTVSTREDQVLAAVAIGASDIDGDQLFYSLKQGADPSKGTVSFSGDKFTYTPADNANGADNFTILISDGNGPPVEQAVSVSIAADDDAPTAVQLAPRVQRIVESTPAKRIKVADISIADIDGGAHALALAGPDAANFEIVGRAVFSGKYRARFRDQDVLFACSYRRRRQRARVRRHEPAPHRAYRQRIGPLRRHGGRKSACRVYRRRRHSRPRRQRRADGGNWQRRHYRRRRTRHHGGRGGRRHVPLQVGQDSTGPTGVLVNNSEFLGNNGPDHRDLIIDFARGADKIHGTDLQSRQRESLEIRNACKSGPRSNLSATRTL